MSKLSERTLLSLVHRSGWSGSKVDQEVSQETRDRKHAERGAGNFTKILVNPKFFTCVTRPLSQADAVWKRLSLPWGHNGERIMSNLAYPQFCQELHAARLTIEMGKIELKRREADIHAEAQTRLADMYNRKEYPSIDEIVDRFGIDVEVRPVPEAGDFRTKLSDATVKGIKRDIEAREKERLEKATRDVYRRVYTVVDTFVDTLKKYEPKTDTSKGKSFQATLVSNVQDVAYLLPTLNISLDKGLDSLSTELLDELTRVPSEALKASEAARETAIQKADKILAKIGGFMT